MIFGEPPLAGADGRDGCEHANGGPQGRRRAQQTALGGRGHQHHPCAQRLAKDPRWRRSRERADWLLSGAGAAGTAADAQGRKT